MPFSFPAAGFDGVEYEKRHYFTGENGKVIEMLIEYGRSLNGTADGF